MSTSYNLWPVVLVNCNLPSWMGMKDSYLMLSMLISGPKALGNDIDVYLQPLTDELKDLWENGVKVYDAASKSNFNVQRSSKSNFNVQVALIRATSDLLGLAVLSGYSTKGKFGCPTCKIETYSLRLRNGHKTCYMGHRRFLPLDHPWCEDAKAFDGTTEHCHAPKEVTGKDVVEQYKLFN
ncbi:hypothetical protein SLA2020_109510 [Shorea laevis]